MNEEIDFNEIVKEFDVTGLTAKKITDEYVLDHFNIEMTAVNTDVLVRHISIEEIMMGQKLPISIYLGVIKNILEKEGATHVRTARIAPGLPPVFELTKTDKTLMNEEAFCNGFKEALKKKLKQKQSKK